jgi:radical SAM-linked protein
MAYTKKQEARYIAHLDLTRVFDRALRRAQIDVAYSEGFNPHPKISFGPPLPVGVEGQREYVDIDLKLPADSEEEGYLAETVEKLQRQLPEGIALIGSKIRPQGDKALMAVINLARYETTVPFLEPQNPAQIEQACQSWLSRKEVIAVRVQKGKRVERNIRPYVSRIERISQDNENEAVLLFDIITGNAGSVRPVEVLESLSSAEGLKVDLPGVYTTREGVYVELPDGSRLDPITYSGKQ